MTYKKITITSFTLMTLLVIYGLIFGNIVSQEIEYGLIYDWVFFGASMIIFYFTYEKLNQSIYTFSGVMFMFVFHIIAAIGLFGLTFFGWLQFDMIMHTTSGIVLFFFAKRLVYGGKNIREVHLYGFLAVLVMMGMSAIHEIIEFFSYTIASGGQGLLTAGGDMVTDYIDVSIDMLCNAIGTSISWIFSLIKGD